MHRLLQLITKTKVVASILKSTEKKIKLSDISSDQKGYLLSGLFALQKKTMVIVAASRDELREYRRDLNILLPEVYIEELYPNDLSAFDNKHRSLETVATRILLLSKIYQNEPVIVLVTAEAFGQFYPSPKELFVQNIIIDVGQKLDMIELITTFSNCGYERTDIVEVAGQFCVRGGIVDIFPINCSQPVRLEWFDDEIDSIRSFSVENQRSLNELKTVEVMPLKSTEKIALESSLLDYLPGDVWFVLDEASRIKEKIEEFVTSGQIEKEKMFAWEKLSSKIVEQSTVLLLENLTSRLFKEFTFVKADIHSVSPYHRQMDLLTQDLQNYLTKGIQPIVSLSSEGKAVGVAKNLAERNLPTAIWQDEYFPENSQQVLFVVGDFAKGVQFVGEDWLLLTEQDIFGVMKRKRLKQKHAGNKIKYFSEIKAGDYVVHNVHGIGKYIGSETIQVSGVNRDYLLIRYAGDDKLYIPVEQVQLLHKYIGAEGHVPRLSRMGGSDWNRVRSKAKAAVTEMAGELLRLQAQRQVLQGHAFSADTVWQKEFEEAFPYEETQDQLKSIEEIKEDMEKPQPMDRLLCGDVGYGKTEVAVRAAFKAVMDGKQVAVLVPTTVLAQQHFMTFSERMAPFGINVDMVSRFRTAKQQRETLAKVAQAKVDVLIGTHRLLQDDVSFKDLGLLIVDEEQRFGVGQKEKIKRWTTNIDVLVLSATPIPRTLHMGLVNARDMSIIETPPEERLPVETYLAEYDDEIVKNAILKELRRGGYVYYVYNKVKDIDQIANKLQELVPEARIKVAHGQMPEELLENAMVDFYEGQYDVLICTTIIENGLDVPLANTIIIHGAENFGLSQLYQMRGRVGRSNRLAYAYFLYPKNKVLSEIAEKRLQAIREFTDLGAGFRIAMRDLEIRGAGNILGPQQHGHIMSVGFETYCRLLEETMLELSEQSPSVQNEVETTIEIDIDAYLPDDYIDEPGHKLDIYRRLPFLNDEQSRQDLLDELIDRFGEPPKAVLQLLHLSMLKGMGRKLGIKSVNLRTPEIKIVFDDKPNVNTEALLNLTKSKTMQVILQQGPPVMLKVKPYKQNAKNVLDLLEEIFKLLL